MQFATVPSRSRETPALTGAPAASATSSLDKRVHGSGASPDAGVLFCAPTAHVTHIKITTLIRLVTSSSEGPGLRPRASMLARHTEHIVAVPQSTPKLPRVSLRRRERSEERRVGKEGRSGW